MKHTFKHCARAVALAVVVVVNALVANALDSSYYAASSKLSSGTWVKISVPQSGIYEITADDIKSWGLGNDLSQIHIFGYGGAPLSETMLGDNYADDLPPMPVVRTGGGILFYGQGPTTWKRLNNNFTQLQVQHPYANLGMYLVTNDPRFADVEIEHAANSPTGSVVTTFTERLYHEQDIINPGETGRAYLGEDFSSNKSQTFKFALDGLVPGSTVKVYTVFGAKLSTNTATVETAYNGTALPATSADVINSSTDTHIHYTLAKSVKQFTLDGTTDLNYTVTYAPSGSTTLARLDYITVNYDRKLELPGRGSLAFGLQEASPTTSYRITGCGATTIVWDVTRPFAPVQMNEDDDDAGTITFSPAEGGRREFIAFDQAGPYPHPALIGNVANQNIHGEATPDMIILAPSAYAEQASRVAALHEQTDGFKVLVLDPEKVYNEFSSGTQDAMAYRRLCKMFHDRGAMVDTASHASHRLGYLLLLGCGSYDNRLVGTDAGILNYPRLLTWQTEMSDNENTSFTSDDYFGVLADGTALAYDTPMDIAVGRMPVKSVSEARAAVNKLVKYVTAPAYGAWKNQILLVADDENQGVHMTQSWNMDTVMMSHGAGDMVHNYVFTDAFNAVSQGGSRNYPDARNKMFTALREGVLWWNYVGHASTQNWTGEGLMMRSDVETNLFYKHLPVLYAATCEYLRFDNSVTSSGELIFSNANGGAIAVMCSPRLAFIFQNGVLTNTVGRYVFTRDEQGRQRRIGDILRLGKNAAAVGDNDNSRRYFVFGDPAMRLAYAPYTAVVETINGQDVDPDNMPVFKARETVEFAGRIVDVNGEPATGFNGQVVSTLFGPEQSVTTHGYGEGVPFTYEDRSNRLAINVDTVSGGRFTVRVVIPAEVNNEYDNYRPALINLYASDSRDGSEAKGACSDFYIYGYDDEQVADTIGPDIIVMGLNDKDFVNGSDVNESPLLLATVADESGVNFSSAGIGHSMTLTLDGTATFNDLVSCYTPMFAEQGTLGSITYQLSDLSKGMHTLRLRVWDVYSNVSEKTLTFNVINGLAPDINDVYCSPSPASDETSFYVTHDRPDAVVSVTVEVFDLMDRMVWSATQAGRSDMYTSAPVTWDLRDTNGRRVPRGIYVYRATISTDGVQEATKAKKLAVTSE